ncbi:hypothetical protein LINPERPRIM_LOCUS7371 [Linum perenne]
MILELIVCHMVSSWSKYRGSKVQWIYYKRNKVSH